MSAITAAVTAAKSTTDRLLSNGNADPASGLIIDYSWDAYTEDFGGNEISVKYWRKGNTWIYTVTNDNADSAFLFSKTGTAKTLKEARLEALNAVVAGCAAQAGKAENGAKEERSASNGRKLMAGHRTCKMILAGASIDDAKASLKDW